MLNKNKYGQYFTSPIIAEFMVSLISKSKNASILEPSCGLGVFLDSLTKSGFINLDAYEIDKTLKTKYDCIKYKSFISASIEKKYDVIIGNPPYIRWKNLEQELKDELCNNYIWNKYFNSLCDYFYFFILKSIELLNDNGELIFICPEYWLNTKHSLSLRNYMCQNGIFEEIYHFKETPLFEKVNASFIIFKYRKTNLNRNSISLYFYNKKGIPNKTELFNRECFDYNIIPQFTQNSKWILASKQIQMELNSFEKSCVNTNDIFSDKVYRIGDFCDIGNGMVSGLDAAFKIDTLNDNLTEYEKKSILTVLKAKDLDRYSYTSESYYIFINNHISELDFKIKYPHFNNILKPHIEKLNKRFSYGKNIPYWQFVFPRNKKLFDRNEQKIFVPCKERISHKKYFRFCLAPKNFYPLQDVTGIAKKESCKESIEYILAYLNSKQVFDWLCYNGVIKGEIVEFSEAPLASIPYRPINWEKEQEVKIHNKIKSEINFYLKTNSETHINTTNRLLNSLLYEQY